MSFREGLEAFLIIAILLKFLDKTNNKNLKKSVWKGTTAGVIGSIIFGLILMGIASYLGGIDTTAKLWESIASLIAVILITTFIVWMINHSNEIKKHIENKAAINLSKKGIFLLALLMIAREGAEISIFAFAGKFSVFPMILGIALSIVLVTLIHHSLIKIKLKTIFQITLIYLIIQAGFLLGYSIHEGLSALKSMEIINNDSIVLNKAFDLSKTILYHKEGILGVPLYVLLGWYSKPEWIQFISQYSYTLLLLGYWYKQRNHEKN
jgi:high-affinity iron transporter